jgi:EpsI family protein
MMASRLRAVLVGVLMAASFAGAAAWRPTVKLADQHPKVNLETMFPKAFGDWVVDDRMPVQLVSPDTAALLNKLYNQTLSRTYVNPNGQRIMLSVAYGGDQSDGTRAHRPEVCYPAQGFQLVSSGTGTLNGDAHSMRVRRLVAKLGGRIEPITYWMVIGERVTVTGTEAKLAQLSYGLRGQVPDGMLMRVSSIDQDSAMAYQVHQQFIAQMARAVPEPLQAMVFGQHAL